MYRQGHLPCWQLSTGAVVERRTRRCLYQTKIINIIFIYLFINQSFTFLLFLIHRRDDFYLRCIVKIVSKKLNINSSTIFSSLGVDSKHWWSGSSLTPHTLPYTTGSVGKCYVDCTFLACVVHFFVFRF